jgi:hypothetical protein
MSERLCTYSAYLSPDWLDRRVLDLVKARYSASWVKLGLDVATESLRWGVNDLSGTLMEESITRMAGGEHGVSLTPQPIVSAVICSESGSRSAHSQASRINRAPSATSSTGPPPLPIQPSTGLVRQSAVGGDVDVRDRDVVGVWHLGPEAVTELADNALRVDLVDQGHVDPSLLGLAVPSCSETSLDGFV